MARTRMPPMGKIPVSTAALRTTSQAAPMSTRPSRLAEYSSVKCGMVLSSREVATDGAVSAVVGLDGITLAGLDGADERAGQHHLSRFQRQTKRRELVGEPRHGGGGMVAHAGG